MVHGSLRSLPTGRVTFLFTDVEGSTRLLRAQGKGYAGLLERHGVILRSAASGGTVFGSAGDALFVAFDDAAAALRAAGRAQQALVNEQWPAEAAVSVRMGVHTGCRKSMRAITLGLTSTGWRGSARLRTVARSSCRTPLAPASLRSQG